MFHSNRVFPVLVLIALCGLFLVSCSDDDPAEPPGGGGNPDTTAPVVAGMDPTPGDPSVDADQPIDIHFSEAMDTDSSTDQVTLSPGTITSLTWMNDDHTLRIDHDAWDPGVEVTVTIGTGLKDVAGNALESSHEARFRVFTDQVLAVGSFPEDGATDVVINGLVNIQFNRKMDVESLERGITITVPDKAAVPFTVEFMGNNTYSLVRESDFPVNTLVTVVAGTECTTASMLGSQPLAEEFTFSFTTGSEADTTPPQILSITPADGETISAFTSSIRIVFDEPIHQESLEFLRINFQLYFAMIIGGVEPAFNPDGTIVTIVLPTPLPDGTPLMFQMGDFKDVSGNVNDTHPVWEVAVAGTADYFPVQDEFFFAYHTEWMDDGPVQAKASGSYTRWQLFEWEDGENFRRYEVEDFETLDEWDYMTRTASAINLRGFREMDEGSPEDLFFDTPVKWLNRPTVTANWSGTVTFGSGEETATVNYDVKVLEGTTEIPFEFLGKSAGAWAGVNKAEDFEVFWSDCRTVILNHDVSVGIQQVETGRDTFYYSPSIGLVEFGTWAEEFDEPRQIWEHGIWSDFIWVDEIK